MAGVEIVRCEFTRAVGQDAGAPERGRVSCSYHKCRRFQLGVGKLASAKYSSSTEDRHLSTLPSLAREPFAISKDGAFDQVSVERNVEQARPLGHDQ